MEIKDIFTEDVIEECLDESPREGFTIEEDGQWEDDGKYSNRCVIVKHQDKFYSLWQSRTGSYYSHYEYDSASPKDVYEVTKREKITHEWVKTE